MTEFKIKVIKQNRILLSILILSVTFPSCMLLSAKLEPILYKIAIPILIVVSISTLLYYFSFGRIRVTLDQRKLHFKWDQKPVFNFRDYDPIKIDEISAIIVDQGRYLRKIKTKNANMELGGITYKNEPSFKLLQLLKSETKIKPINSWDVWKERGWLKIAYRINLVVLCIVIGTVISFIILKGFDSKLLFFMPLVISQLYIGHLQMKRTLK